MKKYHTLKITILLVIIILLDQLTKLATYKFMDYGQDGHINILGKLFGLTYILNPGMAFGLQFNIPYGKILLVGIRIFLSIAIVSIVYSKKSKISEVESFSLTLLLAGAIGNTIDCIFYGKFLNNAPIDAPFQWGYGQVIDMLDLNIYSGICPHWIPFVGGKYISLFPVGNVADVSVLIGIFTLFIYYSFTNKNSENSTVRN